MDVFVLGSYVSAHSLTVRSIPQSGESLLAERLWVEPGGKGLNLAIGLHRQGLKVHALIMAGQDAAGDALVACLQAEGIQATGIVRSDQHSGFGVGLVTDNGENVIAVYPGANARMTAAHVLASSASLQCCQLVCAQFEIPDEPILAAFQLARQAGIPTLLSPSPWRWAASELLALTDLLVLNEPEALGLFGWSGRDDSLPVDKWLALSVPSGWQGEWLVVTLAERGCVAWDKSGKAVHAAPWLCRAIDPTGAGDAFAAGLGSAWLRGLALAEALTFANACGALLASVQGVLPALPSHEQVSAFMAAGSASR